MSDIYYLAAGAETKGPYSKAQLKSMWDQGLITLETQYWTEGMDDWYLASTLLENADEGSLRDSPGVQKFDTSRQPSLISVEAAPHQTASPSQSVTLDPQIPIFSVDLSSVRRKKLDFLAKYWMILSFADSGNIRTYRAQSEDAKRSLIILLRRKLGSSLNIDERIPAQLPPEFPLQTPQCPKCCSFDTYIDVERVAGAALLVSVLLLGLIGLLFAGFWGGLLGLLIIPAFFLGTDTTLMCRQCGYKVKFKQPQ